VKYNLAIITYLVTIKYKTGQTDTYKAAIDSLYPEKPEKNEKELLSQVKHRLDKPENVESISLIATSILTNRMIREGMRPKTIRVRGQEYKV
jgi:hypothetical protein